MASLRVTTAPVVLGTQAEPTPGRRSTGTITEADEARLVVVRGQVRDGPRRTSAGGLSFTLNDGSGPIRVLVAGSTGITAPGVPAGAWVELRGVVGQETSGAEPNAGYRLWPRDRNDVQVIARPGAGGGSPPRPSPRPTAAPSPARGPYPRLMRPILAGEVLGKPSPEVRPGALTAARGQVPPIPLPLAAGLGGLAGLLVLAWRYGTWGRLRNELERQLAVLQARAGDGDEEDESYTPAP
jgi:hypothetical protein